MSPHRLGPLLVLALALLGASPAGAGPATDRLKGFFAAANQVLEGPITYDNALEKLTAIRRLVNDIGDWETAAARALGPEWKARTPEEQREFARLFADLIERMFVGVMASRARVEGGVGITWQGERAEDGEVIVVTAVQGRGSTEFNVEYRMGLVDRQPADPPAQWRIRDVTFDGVSLVDNYRAQFQTVVRRSSYSALVAEMRNRVSETVAAASQPPARTAPAPGPGDGPPASATAAATADPPAAAPVRRVASLPAVDPPVPPVEVSAPPAVATQPVAPPRPVVPERDTAAAVPAPLRLPTPVALAPAPVPAAPARPVPASLPGDGAAVVSPPAPELVPVTPPAVHQPPVVASRPVPSPVAPVVAPPRAVATETSPGGTGDLPRDQASGAVVQAPSGSGRSPMTAPPGAPTPAARDTAPRVADSGGRPDAASASVAPVAALPRVPAVAPAPLHVPAASAPAGRPDPPRLRDVSGDPIPPPAAPASSGGSRMVAAVPRDAPTTPRPFSLPGHAPGVTTAPGPGPAAAAGSTPRADAAIQHLLTWRSAVAAIPAPAAQDAPVRMPAPAAAVSPPAPVPGGTLGTALPPTARPLPAPPASSFRRSRDREGDLEFSLVMPEPYALALARAPRASATAPAAADATASDLAADARMHEPRTAWGVEAPLPPTPPRPTVVAPRAPVTAKPALPAMSEAGPARHIAATRPPSVEEAPKTPPQVYWVQVGAFATQEGLARTVEKVRGWSYQIVLGPSKQRGVSLTRVRVGPFTHRADAVAALSVLQKQFPDGQIVP